MVKILIVAAEPFRSSAAKRHPSPLLTSGRGSTGDCICSHPLMHCRVHLHPRGTKQPLMQSLGLRPAPSVLVLGAAILVLCLLERVPFPTNMVTAAGDRGSPGPAAGHGQRMCRQDHLLLLRSNREIGSREKTEEQLQKQSTTAPRRNRASFLRARSLLRRRCSPREVSVRPGSPRPFPSVTVRWHPPPAAAAAGGAGGGGARRVPAGGGREAAGASPPPLPASAPGPAASPSSAAKHELLFPQFTVVVRAATGPTASCYTAPQEAQSLTRCPHTGPLNPLVYCSSG